MARTNGTPNAVEAARGRVHELLDTEVAYAATRRRHVAELEEVRATNGARILAGELTAEEAGRRVAELTGAVEAAGAAILAARAQRRESIQTLREAVAATHEAGAEDLERQAAAIEQQAAEPLARLQELEGCAYVPAAEVELARWRAVRGPSDQHEGITITIPRSQALRRQAAELRTRAGAERDRRIVDAGIIETPSVGELVRRVTADPEALGPPLHMLEEWATRAVAEELAERARQARRVPEHADNWRPATGAEPIAIAVTWRGGELVERECRATCLWARPEAPEVGSWVPGWGPREPASAAADA